VDATVTILPQANGFPDTPLTVSSTAADGSGAGATVIVDTDSHTLVTPTLDIISKTCTTPVDAGDSGTCVITLQNIDPAGPTAATAENASISDTFPVELTPTSGSRTGGTAVDPAGTCTVTGQTVECGDTDLAPGETVIFTINFDASINVPNNTVVNNPVPGTLTMESDEVDETADPATAAVTITADEEINILKTVSQSSASAIPAEDFTFFIVVTNSGTAPQTNVIVTDTPPAGVIFDTVSAGCTPVTLAAGCNVGTIDAGGSLVITVEASWDQAALPANGTSVNNEATVTSDFQALAIAADVDVTRQDDPDVNISKTGPATALQGDTVTYTITITNNGGGDADVDVTDVIPGGVTISNVTCSGVLVATNNVTDGVCSGIVSGASSETMTVEVDIPDTAALGTVIQDVATLELSGTFVMTATAVTTVIGPNVIMEDL
jgi:uncharacterized repeat protein (TIGR01451 family)